MRSGVTPSSNEDLDRLRQRYERLCDLMTRTAEADPDAAERVLVELQQVSEQLMVLEGAAPAGPGPAAEAPGPEAAAEAEGLPPVRPTGRADTQSQPASGPAPVAVPPTEPASPPTRDATPPIREAPTEAAGAHEPPDTRVVAFRAGAPGGEPARAGAAPSAPETPQLNSARPSPAQPGSARPQPGQPPATGSATLFSSAIRQWLERQRDASEQPGTQPGTQTAAQSRAQASPPAPPAAAAQGVPTPSPAAPSTAGAMELDRIAASVAQQAAQIERILALCESHQTALERLEARIEARLTTAPSAPSAVDPDLPELRHAIEEQRQRITSLAKTIHNLAQWLASQRTPPGR